MRTPWRTGVGLLLALTVTFACTARPARAADNDVGPDPKEVQAVLDKAIEQYRRDTFFRELNESFVRLQADPEAWKEELAERQEWDTTLMDGLTSE